MLECSLVDVEFLHINMMKRGPKAIKRLSEDKRWHHPFLCFSLSTIFYYQYQYKLIHFTNACFI